MALMTAVPELASNLSMMISKGACNIIFHVVLMLDMHLEFLGFSNRWGVFIHRCNSTILGHFFLILKFATTPKQHAQDTLG